MQVILEKRNVLVHNINMYLNRRISKCDKLCMLTQITGSELRMGKCCGVYSLRWIYGEMTDCEMQLTCVFEVLIGFDASRNL